MTESAYRGGGRGEGEPDTGTGGRPQTARWRQSTRDPEPSSRGVSTCLVIDGRGGDGTRNPVAMPAATRLRVNCTITAFNKLGDDPLGAVYSNRPLRVYTT